MSDDTTPYVSPHSEVDDAATSGRHPVNVAHLVMGIAFLGLAGIWALFQTESIGRDDLRWFLPLPWLAAGLAGLLALSLAARRPRRDHPAHGEFDADADLR